MDSPSSPRPATFWNYLRERFSPIRWGPVALFLGLACHAIQPFTSRNGAILHLTFLFACILQFRIWDDLADLDLDRDKHPQRVLGRTSHQLPYWITVLGVGLFTLAFLLATEGDMRAATLYGSLLLLTFGIYRGLTNSRYRGLRNHLVLLKYPLLVAIFRHQALSAGNPRDWTLLGAVLLSFAIHEVLDDPELGLGSWSRVVYGLESALLLLLLGLLLPISPPSPAWAIWGAFGVLAGKALTRKGDFRSIFMASTSPFLLTATVLAVTL
jgi:hypothetical protein